MQAAERAVHVDETRRDARQLSLALVGGGRHVDGVGEGFGKALEAAIVAAGFGQLVETALGFLDLVARRGFDRGVIRDIDQILADADQVPADREVVHRAAIILRVDDGRGLGGKAGEILRDRHAAEILVAHEGLHGRRRRDLAGLDQAGCHFVDPPVQVLEEMLRLEEVRDAVIGVVIHQDRAEQSLFRVDIAGRRPVFRGGRLNTGDQGVGAGHLLLRRQGRAGRPS